jgi:hypothetical protein
MLFTKTQRQYPAIESNTYYTTHNNQEVIDIYTSKYAFEQNKFNQVKPENSAIADNVLLTTLFVLLLSSTGIVLNKLNQRKRVNVPCKTVNFIAIIIFLNALSIRPMS